MDGWMGEWIDGWADNQEVEWMPGWMDDWIYGQLGRKQWM